MKKTLEKKIISHRPPFMLLGAFLHTHEFDPVVKGFYVGREALVSINPEVISEHSKARELSERALFIGQLASLGIPHATIADEIGLTPKSLAAPLKKVRNAFEVERTTALARTFFDMGYFAVEHATEPLGLDPQEAAAIDLASYGTQHSEIDELQKSQYGADFRTIHAILADIERRTNWSDTTSIVVRSIVGGDIGNFVPDTPAS